MKKHAFVTGATGFLGRHVIEQLQKADWSITAMHRPNSNIERLSQPGIRRVTADLHDAESVWKAMPDRVDAVLHLAANTSMWPLVHRQQTRDNVEGTHNVLSAALSRNARRFVYVSSIAAYGLRNDVINEDSEQRGARAPINYYRSKARAEEEVRVIHAQGLPTVIINPSHIIGPYDTHNWSRIFRLIGQEKLPGIPPGAGSFCYAPEVAKTIIAAAERRSAEGNYLLGGSEASFLDVINHAGAILGKKTPRNTVPAWLLKLIGRKNNLFSYLTRTEPELTYESALIVCSHARVASTRAQEELGYKAVPVSFMISETIKWMRREGML